MIDNEAKNRLAEIITHEMFEMQRAMDVAMVATQSRLAAKGALQSGAAMQLLRADAVGSLKARGQFILGQLLRCLTAYRVPLTDENLKEAITLLQDAIQREDQLVRSQLFNRAPFSGNPGFGPAKQQIEAEYAQEAPRLANRLINELKIAAAASAAPQSEPGTTYNFSGPVALVQTGDGSQATVTQNITTETKAEIARALQELLARIDADAVRDPSREQLRALVEETKAEAEKPNANPLKLGSSLRTIAETTKFIGSLGPAYEVIKPFLAYFGIHMP